jgi:hypothetical protein
MATKPLAGYNGRISINGTISYLNQYTITGTGGDIKCPTFECDAYMVRIGGMVEAKLVCKGYWDADNVPHDDPLSLIPSDTVENIILYPDQNDDSTTYNFDAMLITEFTTTGVADMEGRIDFEFTAMSTGPYTLSGNPGNGT